MAKKPQSAPDPIDAEEADLAEQLAAEMEPETPAPVAPPAVKTKPPAIDAVLLELPIGPLPVSCYMTDHIDIKVPRGERAALHRLLHGLSGRHVQLRGGRHVEKPGHAVQWLLEQIADQLDAAA